ncbi:MAG: hypothetical protein HY078_09475 [Elusimicrobia bacterium]|nr:hypothetical protein [Elusimicrobiota bacterium]
MNANAGMTLVLTDQGRGFRRTWLVLLVGTLAIWGAVSAFWGADLRDVSWLPPPLRGQTQLNMLMAAWAAFCLALALTGKRKSVIVELDAASLRLLGGIRTKEVAVPALASIVRRQSNSEGGSGDVVVFRARDGSELLSVEDSLLPWYDWIRLLKALALLSPAIEYDDWIKRYLLLSHRKMQAERRPSDGALVVRVSGNTSARVPAAHFSGRLAQTAGVVSLVFGGLTAAAVWFSSRDLIVMFLGGWAVIALMLAQAWWESRVLLALFDWGLEAAYPLKRPLKITWAELRRVDVEDFFISRWITFENYAGRKARIPIQADGLGTLREMLEKNAPGVYERSRPVDPDAIDPFDLMT